MAMRESDLLDAALLTNTTTDFNTEKPWDHTLAPHSTRGTILVCPP